MLHHMPVYVARPPCPALRPFVAVLWASTGPATPAPGATRELALPTGAMHVVVRLDRRPVRVADVGGASQSVGDAVVCGVRTRPYLRDVSAPAPAVGALLRPGVASLFGVPGHALAEAHTPLDALWTDVEGLRDRLADARTLDGRLALLEAELLAHRPGPHAPLIAHALARFAGGAGVGAVARESGWSHRHVTTRFREAIGVAPRTFCRLARFGRAVRRLSAEPSLGLAELALVAGYADQPHLTRDFGTFGGLSPGRYRDLAPVSPLHVPWSNSFKTQAG